MKHEIMRWKTEKRWKKKAIYFSIDALIAALILVAGLLLMTKSHVSEQPRTLINHLSKDMMNVLGEITIAEVNNSYIQELIDNGTLTHWNDTVLEAAGILWSNSSLQEAHDLLENVSEGILPANYGYSISIANSTLYTMTNPVTNSLVVSKRIITGIEESKPIKGYIARARASMVRKTTNIVIPFSPGGAGWKGSTNNPGIVTVEKLFEMPNASINSILMYLSLHLDRGSTNWNVLEINHGQCNITRDDMNLGAGSEGVFRVFNMSTDCVNVGENNTITLDLRNIGYNAHIHPGTFMIINYNQTSTPPIITNERSERIYFDNVNSTQGGGVSGAGPWTITPFHLPTEAENISVKIQVAGRGIYDYTASCTPSRRFSGWGGNRCYRDYDYMIFLNDEEPFDSDAHPAENPLYTYNATQTGPKLIDGTNIIAVYFNNFNDDYWGEGEELIYSDPTGNTSGSSYVEVNYTMPVDVPYGSIEIRQVEDFGGIENPIKDTNFSFPPDIEGPTTVFVHPVERYSYITRVYSDTGYPPTNLVFESPASRAVPTSVYVPLETLDTTPLVDNYLRIEETSGNDILPNSTVDYGFYVKGLVGYGDVFTTQGQSITDAITRLQELMGDYATVTDMVIENTTMADVPSMWGPAVIEVSVWN